MVYRFRAPNQGDRNNLREAQIDFIGAKPSEITDLSVRELEETMINDRPIE